MSRSSRSAMLEEEATIATHLAREQAIAQAAKEQATSDRKRAEESSCWCGINHNTDELLTEYRGRSLLPGQAASVQPPSPSLYVSNLPFSLTTDQIGPILTAMVKHAGVSIEKVHVLLDKRKDDGSHAGAAILAFQDERMAGKALAVLFEHEVSNEFGRKRILRADYAKPREQRGR